MTLSLLLGAHALATSPAQDGAPNGPKRVSVGEKVVEVELEGVLRGDGRRRLSELYGRPVLIVNFADNDFQRDFAKSATKLAEELDPDDLVVILHGTEHTEATALEAFAMRHFPGSRPWLLPRHNVPFDYSNREWPPMVALVGADGRLLVAASAWVDGSKFVAQTREEVKRSKAGWGEHKDVKKARKIAFGEHALSKALGFIEDRLEKRDPPEELEDVRTEVEARYASWRASVEYLIEQSEVSRALESAEALAKAVRGREDWEAEVDALLERFESDELEAELAVDKKLASALRVARTKGLKGGEAKKLLKLAEKYPDTGVGRRAGHLAKVVELAGG